MPGQDLIFSNPAAPVVGGPVELVFGATAGPEHETVSLQGGGRVTRMRGSALVRTAALVRCAGRITRLGGRVGTRWDANVTRGGVRAELQAQWQPAQPLASALQAAWQQAVPLRVAAAAVWQGAQPVAVPFRSHWQETERLRHATHSHWQQGELRRAAVDSLWQEAIRLRAATRLHWQQGEQRRGAVNVLWQETLRLRAASRTHWQDAAPLRALVRSGYGDGQAVRVSLRAHWQEAMRPRPGRSDIVPPVRPPCYVPGMPIDLVFRARGDSGMPVILIFKCDGHDVLPPEPGATVVVPVRKVYLVINDVSLRRVDGNIPLPSTSLSLSLDVDSWTWSFSAALPGRVLSDLEPGSNGAPAELEAMINGTTFRVLVESISRERTFGRNDIRVQGRGKTALLDSPYAPLRNFSHGLARTAQQLMLDVLTINGVSMPWAVDWRLTDWLVPGNVWAHQGSYISALNTIARAAGGYIQPHASLQTIHVLPRYPEAPWDWAARVTPDFELPSDVTVREGIEWVEKPRYDSVYISGQQQGVLGQVTRTGTAGALLAPMLTDALITHSDAARQRGISVLSDVGRQANLSLSLPVLPETGIITPGKFVRYTDAGVNRLGIVRSTSVEAGFPVVRQTLGVQTYA